MSLYPLRFKPIYKSKIWGGSRIADTFDRKPHPPEKCGESWELSAVRGNLSVVANGFLKGNNIQELVEVYMGDLVGEKVYDKFGIEFPILVKFIDANDLLSIQVHPGDKLAASRHHAYGKNELWYIIDADADARIFAGFSSPVTKDMYLESFYQKKLINLLNVENVSKSDVFFIPAGTVHAISKGVFLAEIQQTSDVTYRIYDWDRTDEKGKARELHTDLALQAIEFEKEYHSRIHYHSSLNQRDQVIAKPCFHVNHISFDQPFSPDYSRLDSFVIYLCIDGQMQIEGDFEPVSVSKGSCILIPAELQDFKLKPVLKTTLLEIFIP